MDLCMRDNSGRKVKEPLPHMQSQDALRYMIRHDMQTSACFAELKKRAERVRAAMLVINRKAHP